MHPEKQKLFALSRQLAFAKEIAEQCFLQGVTRKSTLNSSRLLPALSAEFIALSEEQQLSCFLLAGRIIKRGLPIVLWNGGNISLESTSPTDASLLAPVECLSLAKLQERLHELQAHKELPVLFFVDQLFHDLHKQSLRKMFLPQSHIVEIEATETKKNLDIIFQVLAYIEKLENHPQLFVSLGGGICSDITGFIGGLCNTDFMVVPTTYLSAVDAGQGGKTGVNFPPFGKNQIGLFAGAQRFFLCEDFFNTMHHAEKISGFCEALKHCVLFGKQPPKVDVAKNFTLSSEFLLWNLHAKSLVVKWDQKETNGLRLLLNFGHTIGHVWEGLSEAGFATKIPHGAAVALGVLFLHSKHWMATLPEDVLELFQKSVQFFNPQITLNQDTQQLFLQLIRGDKKNSNSASVIFVTPTWGCLAPLETEDFQLQGMQVERYQRAAEPNTVWQEFHDFCKEFL